MSVADPAAEHVRKTLEQLSVRAEAIRTRVRELEAAGHRIVGGGQTGTPDVDGRSPWDATDWRSGAVLFSGHGSYEDYIAATDQHDPDGKWIHIDALTENFDLIEVEPASGLPPSLASVLQEWAEDADPDEVAEFVSWSPDRVRLAQASDSDLRSTL